MIQWDLRHRLNQRVDGTSCALQLRVSDCLIFSALFESSTPLIRARAPLPTLTPSLLPPGTPLSLHWLHNPLQHGGWVDDHNSKAA